MRRTRTYGLRFRAALALLVMATLCAGGCRLPFSRQAAATDPFQTPVTPGDTADTLPKPADPPGVSLPKEEPAPATTAADADQGGIPIHLESLKILAPANVAKSMKNAVGLGVDHNVAREAYAEGDRLFREQNYADAASQYRKAARRWPDSVLEEDALFMQAESLFFADKYSKASDVYNNLMKKYENSRYLDKITARQFSIARYWEERAQSTYTLLPNFTDKKRPVFDAGGNAVALYESIRLNDPTGPLADDAVMATATHYFLDEHFEDADYYYSLLRTEYPRSEHQTKAHLVGVEAKLQSYQGAQYAEGPLNEAGKLIDTTLAQYGDQMPEERARLLATKNTVRLKQAEREWVSADYYYRRKHYRAAKFHYDRLIRDYPETDYAARAHERIEQVKDLPPEPPPRFVWLGWIFGETGKKPTR